MVGVGERWKYIMIAVMGGERRNESPPSSGLK